MLIRIPKKSDPKPSEITPESVYLDRRKFMGAGAALVASAAGLVGRPSRLLARPRREAASPGSPGIAGERPAPQELGPFTYGEGLRDELTPYEDVTTYNNFYEFGTAKEDPSRHAPGLFEPEPWTVAVDGHAEKTGTFDVEELLPRSEWEERIYRLRCVEAWSMVIPWVGVPLRNVISRLEPTSRARYVRFETVVRPEQMPGQRRSILDWPYVEGLRIDEATNQLALLSTGLYGKELPVQNGAPLRLVVPWKYGFKSIKSIVRISFVEEMPLNTWKQQASNEYGFFANVNPEVDHPRWSQARERRIGEFRRRETMMFNGYGEEVAHLYRGMDLSRWY